MNFPEAFKRADIRSVICLFSAILLTGVWSLTIYQLRHAHAARIDGAERDARSFARAFEEHTARTIESADQAVTFLQYRYNTMGNDLDIVKDLQSGVILGDIYNLFTIVDEHGYVALSSKPFSKMNLADREHIRVHMDANTGKLFVSKPVLGRVSGKWSIQMTRRINDAQGGFKGVVVVSMDPFYFTRLYHDIELGGHSSIAIIGEDGVVRARRSGDSEALDQNISQTPLFREMQAVSSGTFTTRSPIDGRKRLYAYRKLQQYPLYVLVGLDLEDVLAPYYANRIQALALAIVTTTIILVFSLVIVILVRRLIDSRNQAVAASRAKSQFLANMSHELRTPLNGILGYAELLKDELASSVQASFARTIHECGLHLLALVNSVLDLSKVESGQIEISNRPMHLPELLHQTINNHAFSAARKGIELSLQAPGVPEMIFCDATRLQQILNNLLHNAIKFTERGAVRLTVTASATELAFCVIDTGIGIPAELHEAIFDKFYQVDASHARVRDGAGLGLAITRPMVEAMGGRFSLQSTPGAGSIFSFTLPLYLPPSIGGEEDKQSPALAEHA